MYYVCNCNLSFSSVELAKNCYYKDRLLQEKQITESDTNNIITINNTFENNPFVDNILNIKKSRDRLMAVSVQPITAFSKSKSDLICGKLTKFNDNGLADNVQQNKEKTDKIVSKSAEYQGGGRRVGFGSLLQSNTPNDTSNSNNSNSNKPVDDKYMIDDIPIPLTKNQLNILKDTYREELLPVGDIANKESSSSINGLVDGLDSITEEALQQERERQRNILNLVLGANQHIECESAATANMMHATSSKTSSKNTTSTTNTTSGTVSHTNPSIKSHSTEPAYNESQNNVTYNNFADLNTLKNLFGREVRLLL
jgi:hypothetical protein